MWLLPTCGPNCTTKLPATPLPTPNCGFPEWVSSKQRYINTPPCPSNKNKPTLFLDKLVFSLTIAPFRAPQFVFRACGGSIVRLKMNTPDIFARPKPTRRPANLSAISKPQRGPQEVGEDSLGRSEVFARDQLHNTHDEPNTCLSAEPHEHAVIDPVQHYFGCIEICQRPCFFADSNPVWIEEHERQKLRTTDDDLNHPRITSETRERMLSAAIAIEAQYKRNEALRMAIQQAPDFNGQAALISNIDYSGTKWMTSASTQDGLQAVRAWRAGDQGGKRLAVSPRGFDTGRLEVLEYYQKPPN